MPAEPVSFFGMMQMPRGQFIAMRHLGRLPGADPSPHLHFVKIQGPDAAYEDQLLVARDERLPEDQPLDRGF